MSDEVPRGWRTVRLGDLADINPESLGQRTSPDFAFGYIDISQIDQPGVCLGWAPTIFATAPSRARRVVRENDILVSTVRPYLKAFAKVPSSDLPLIASTGFAVVRAHEDTNQDFLFHHIMTADFIEHLKPRMTGSNYPAVSADDVSDYELHCPPLDEQHRIAEVLRSLDDAVGFTQKAADQHRTLWEVVAEDLIWRPTLVDDTMLAPLARLIRASDYGVNAPLSDQPGGTAVLRMGNVQQGQIDLTSLKWGEIAEAEAAALKLRDGDILFNRTNSRDLVGKVAFVRGEPNYLYASYLVRLSVERGIADPYFVFAAMNSRRGQTAIRTIATPGVSQSNINPTNLKKLLFPSLPLGRQREVSALLQDVEAAWLSARREAERLRTLRSSIRSQLLSGRVRVPA